MRITFFPCLDKSSKPSGSFTIEEALEYIKSNPQKQIIQFAKNDLTLGGKQNTNLVHKDRVWKNNAFEFVQRNEYNHVKSTQCRVVTWNCFVEEKRELKRIQFLSSYMYFDVDNFSELIQKGKANDNHSAKGYVKKVLSSRNLPFVKAVWDSFGGDGLGFLVKVNNLTLENFKPTWEKINQMFKDWGITIDPQTKDITRCNVLPSDENIFIREDKDLSPIEAAEYKEVQTTSVQSDALPIEVANDLLDYFFESFYRNDSSWRDGKYGFGGLGYKFFFHFFTFCNKMRINLSDGLNYLIEKDASYPIFTHKSVDVVQHEIIDVIQHYYGDQFGCQNIDNSFGNYDIYAIGRKFHGDAKMYLSILYADIFSHTNISEQDKVKKIAIKAKEAGILRNELLDFLSKGQDTPKEIYNIAKEIYGDTYYHFGILKVITEAGIKNRLSSFEVWASENSYRVIKVDSFTGKLNESMGEIISNSQAIFGALTQNNLIEMLIYIFRNAKHLGITKEASCEFLTSLKEEFDQYFEFSNTVAYKNRQAIEDTFYEYLNDVAKYVYTTDSWRFGVRIVRILTPEKIRERYNIKKEYFLERGQYINQIGLERANNQIVWGNTGQGKTTWICEHQKGTRSVILVPIIPLLKGIQIGYKASVFYRDKKNVQEGDDLIVCTYSSFPNLLKIMKKWENVKIEDYDLFFDEEHNLAVSSNPDFRGFELNCILDNIHLFKTVNFLTGTMFPVLHPALSNFEIVRTNWKQTPEKICTPVRYDNILVAVERLLSKNGKNMIYLQNKKEDGQLGSLMDFLELKGWNKDRILLLNADQKDSEGFNYLIEHELVQDNYDIVICTSVVVEGVNIYNGDFKTVHFLTPESAINMEQFVNRLRDVYTKGNKVESMIYIYKPIDKPDEVDTDHVDVIQIQKKLIQTAKDGLELFSRAYTSGDSISLKSSMKMFSQQIFGKSALYRNNNGIWEVDYLSIANMAYQEEKAYAAKNLEFMKILLNEYNWVFKEEIIITEKLDVDDKSYLDASKAERKDKNISFAMGILDDIEAEGEEVCITKVEDSNLKEIESLEKPHLQVSLRAKVKYLVNSMSFEDALVLMRDWVAIHKLSDRVWTKIARQITVQVSLNLGVNKKGKDNSSKFAKKIFEWYREVKKQEAKTQMNIFFAPTALEEKISSITGETSNVMNVLKDYFDLEERLEGDKIHYRLAGIKIKNEISTFTNLILKWGQEMLDAKKAITNEELAKKINKIRSKLPILSSYPLSTRNAMRLVHDYFTFVRVGTKNVKGKKTNTYAVTSLTPEELSLVTITPLRRVNIMEKHDDDLSSAELYEKYANEVFSDLNYHATMSVDGIMAQ